MRAAALLLVGCLLGAEERLLTVPERTGHQRTSTVEEVGAFMDELARRHPELKRYAPPGAPEHAEAGAPLMAWRLPATGSDPLRVYLNGNIHAGEVEGKEAIQIFVRELLEGRHHELRKHLDFVFVPAYNADATDALDPAIRRWQPNPASGVGRRENARGLDLNRDLMKAEAASTRFFQAIARDFDPQFLMDLHTTNGSYHGFHLTYTPSGVLGGDAELQRFNRRLTTEVREALKRDGMPTYEYGDFMPDEPGRRGGRPEKWGEAHPLPRYLVSYQALRNRVGVLSECYVHLAFPKRIEATRRFAIACLAWAAAHREEIRSQSAAAEARWLKQRSALPLAFQPEVLETYTFEVITPLRNTDRQLIGETARTTATLPTLLAWKNLDLTPLPEGFLVDAAYAEPIRTALERHGIRVLPGSARPTGKPVLHFHESARELAPDGYQGTFPLTLKGAWKATPHAKPLALAWTEADFDRALWIPLSQPLGRLAFYLLDPRSPDGLVYWGAFHSALVRSPRMWGEPPRFPILAVGTSSSVPGTSTAPLDTKQE